MWLVVAVVLCVVAPSCWVRVQQQKQTKTLLDTTVPKILLGHQVAKGGITQRISRVWNCHIGVARIIAI